MEVLDQNIQFVKGVGPDRAQLFERIGVQTVEELLYLVPRDYQEWRQATTTGRLVDGDLHTLWLKLEYVDGRTTRSGVPVVEAVFSDQEGFLTAVWFNRPTVADSLRLDECYRITGKAKKVDGRWKMTNPLIAAVATSPDEPSQKLLPVYPLTDGLHPAAIRDAVGEAINRFAPLVPDLLPEPIRRQKSLLPTAQALDKLHRPKSSEDVAQARTRLIYDEFLILQVALALKRAGLSKQTGQVVAVNPEVDRRIRQRLPFSLTDDQNKAIAEITRDLAAASPMNRLLQGDVGCGKTAVALYAMLATIANGMQAVLMAPTEVLAKQHFRNFDKLLSQSRVRRALLTGSLHRSRRAEVLADLQVGNLDLVVGTHALVQPDVQFARLGLVVIDEQHKFGVRQRAQFQRCTPTPNYLVMTATPIPRSLCLTWFGDLDLSVIRQKPPGRQPTLSYVVPAAERAKAYDFLEKQVRLGRQALVVCPRIDGEESTVQSVKNVVTELREHRFADVEIGQVHGRMDDAQKDQILRRFESGDLRILVSTVVVEVGIDVPGANVLLIEGADRFGLSQLHQIRGRVGRGAERGICFFIDSSDGDPAVRERLTELANTNDGFAIAELDARLRGVGEIIGARQHGVTRLRIGSIHSDAELLQQAREDAQRIVNADPGLTSGAWANLRTQVIRRYGRVFDLALVG